MIDREYLVKDLPQGQAESLIMLLDEIGEIKATDEELKSLSWLAGWEKDTVKNICSVILKTKSRVMSEIADLLFCPDDVEYIAPGEYEEETL